jgi:hypothetical protein
VAHHSDGLTVHDPRPRPAPTHWEIADHDDLTELRAAGRHPIDVLITIEGVSAAGRARSGQRLERLGRACGCNSGAAATLAALAAVALTTTIRFIDTGVARPQSGHVLLAFGTIAMAALVGKALGLATVEVRWRAELRRLRAAATAPNG